MDAQHGKVRSATMLLKKRLVAATSVPKTTRGRGKQRETKQIKVSYSPQLVTTLNDVIAKWNREPDVFCASINGESRKWGTPNVYVKLFNVCSVALYIGFGPSDPAPSMYRTVVLKFNIGKSALATESGEKEEDCFISYCPIIKRGLANHIQESDIVAAVELVMEFFWRVSYFYQNRHPAKRASEDLINLYKDSRRLGGKAFTQQTIEGKHDLHAKKVSDQFKGIVTDKPKIDDATPVSLPGYPEPTPVPTPVLTPSPWKPASLLSFASSTVTAVTAVSGSSVSLGLSKLGFSEDFIKRMNENSERHAATFADFL